MKQNKLTMEYKIVSSTYPEGLTSKVKEMMEEGWKPIGGHSVVETHKQNRYSGAQHMDTIIKIEYSQTMIKD
jgi:hypothetical protein